MRPRLLAFFVLLTAAAGVLRAQAFPPITDEERALTSVPGEPNAPAVVLFRKGEFLMEGYGRLLGSFDSHLRVQTRVKILTESGKSNGEIAIAHSDFTRLEGFSARTVLPDGTIVPVPAGAKFERRTSRRYKTFVTSVAFPSVQVGAILDYQYELVFDSPIFLEPWYFSDEEMPVRHSEIVYRTAADWRMRYWSRSLGVKIQKEEETSSKGHVLRVWAENLPSIPQEPQGPPFADLAAQVLLLPETHTKGLQVVHFLESWPSTTYLIEQLYESVRQRDGGVAKQAREIAGSGTRQQKIEALYRFVRDEIATETDTGQGVVVDPGASLAKVLSGRRGSTAEKALLLQAMLKAVDVDSGLVWAGDRHRGAIDTHLPNPGWFDAVFVMVLDEDRQRLFLDPADRGLALGQIPAGYEGMPALVPNPTKPLGLILPTTPFEQNLRRADLDLTLNAQGRLSGTGTLLLTGHPAWEKISREADPARTAADWKEWLGSRFPEFQIADVKAVESVEERKVTVTWTLTQREEEVLGDEVSLTPSAPLGPLTQPFVQPASERRTGVAFDYLDREETVLHLCWPEGWKLESRPRETTLSGAAGLLTVSAELQEGERLLVYTRRRDLLQRDFFPQEYETARSLFGELAKSDAQKILLVRRP
jgi:hypothetical protein